MVDQNQPLSRSVLLKIFKTILTVVSLSELEIVSEVDVYIYTVFYAYVF